MICCRLVLVATLTLCLTGCSKKNTAVSASSQAAPSDAVKATPPAALPPPPADSKTALTAAMPDPINVDLTWKTTQSGVQGHFVEYTSDPRDEWVILGIIPEPTAAYRHPDLAPETRFIYRVRPYYGSASKQIDVTTGKTPANPSEGIEGDNDPVVDKATPEELAKKKSLRSQATAEEAAPTDLTGTFVSPVSVALRWKDRANDEDGYLIEGTPDPAQGWVPMALMPVDCVSFIMPGLPPDTKCYFRVRAYYHGPASNYGDKTTGKEPPGYYEKRDAEAKAAEAEALKAEEAAKAAEKTGTPAPVPAPKP